MYNTTHSLNCLEAWKVHVALHIAQSREIPEPIKTINRLPRLSTSVELLYILILCEVVLFLSTCRSLYLPLDRAYSHNQGCLSASLPSPLPFPLHLTTAPYTHVLMRDEKEGRKKHVHLAKAQLLQLDLEIAHHAYTDSTTLVLGRKQDTHAHKYSRLAHSATHPAHLKLNRRAVHTLPSSLPERFAG